jgi:hypothetical protein
MGTDRHGFLTTEMGCFFVGMPGGWTARRKRSSNTGSERMRGVVVLPEISNDFARVDIRIMKSWQQIL